MKLPILLLCLALAASSAPAQEFGTIRATTKLRGDGSTSTTVLDPEKKTAEETITTPDGRVQRKVLYMMDETNTAFGAVFSDARGNIIYKAGYKRDGQGRVTESSFTSKDGKYLGKRMFYYTGGEQATTVEDYDAADRLIPAKPKSAGIPDKKKRR